jgi:23S rRNA pseudouridine2605 synthase
VEERLQKLISQAGITSRRAAEDLIRQGRVTVNGKAAHLGDKADLTRDEVRVDGHKLEAKPEFVYVLLNKPRGVICTNQPYPGDKRRTVRSLIPHEGHIYTVGRLDADSEGVILLTNDGELANKLTHPRYEHTKTYRVLVEGTPSRQTLDTWRQGVMLDEKRTAPAKVRVLSSGPEGTWLQIVMREGRKRQIRRVAAMLGHPVKHLIRIQIAMLEIGHLRSGQWRELSAKEVRLLKEQS